MALNVNAQNWLDTKFNKTDTEINLHNKKTVGDDGDELTGELVIDGYTNLEKLNLERWDNTNANKLPGKMSKVIIKNCPNLQEIDLDQNEIEEVIFEGNPSDFAKVQRLDINRNKLKKIDVSKLRHLGHLDLQNNADLDGKDIRGIENLLKLSLFSARGVKNGGFNGEYSREWKDAIRNLLGITSGELTGNWQNVLTNKLGGVNLTNIPSGQTLKSLIDLFGTPQSTLQQQLNQAKAELDSKKDYDAIKQQLEAIRNELGLGNNATQAQIISKIQELKGRPTTTACTHTDYDSIKAERDRLKTENNRLKNNHKGGITKEIIVRELKNWGISVPTTRKVELKTYSEEELIKYRNDSVSGKLTELENKEKNAFYLNVGLGALSIVSLIVIAWMVVKQNSLPKIEQEPKKMKE